ncbi:peptidylprolyl isomerase [Geomonas terrae]|uniref:Peptidylprolyl isomerase n=1 Tax=Geomonas terrae TaxID=2562681 RepID=A0A4S1CLH6_9BACT|nr:peptidylprolyl isomerase [Geomonas terrae]TGU74086.1 peptidylprolyl isomerase [Geomonas terrae]
MFFSNRTMRAAIIASFFSLALSACDASREEHGEAASLLAPEGAPNEPIQKVNGSVITRGSVQRRLQLLLDRRGPVQPTGPEEIRLLRREALEQLIAAELLYQEARKSPVKNLDELVAQRIEQYRNRLPSDDAFARSLDEAGLSLPILQQEVRKELVVSDFVDTRFGQKVSVSEDEALSFYEENREKFKTGSSVRASQILVAVKEPCGERDKKEAMEKAEQLLQRVRQGENFGIIAQLQSDCASKVRGGDLGFFSRGDTNPRIEQVAFTLKPGEISNIVQTSYGYHILKLTEKRPPRLETYDEARGEIFQLLKREKTMKLAAEHVAQLRARARVERVTRQ